MDSFRDKFKSFADKVNSKLEESISAAEERARVSNERNMVYREKLEEIKKRIADEEDFLKRFNDALGISQQEQFEVDQPSAKEGVIQQYLPVISDILRDKAGPAIVDILSDASRLTELARSSYQALPMPVRMVVKEQSFIDWIISHQGDITARLRSKLAREVCEESSPNILPPGDCPDPTIAVESDS